MVANEVAKKGGGRNLGEAEDLGMDGGEVGVKVGCEGPFGPVGGWSAVICILVFVWIRPSCARV